MKRLFQIIYGIIGIYLLYESYYLSRIVPDGDGIGFYPFGIKVLLPNNSISSVALFTSVVGVIIVFVPVVLAMMGRKAE